MLSFRRILAAASAVTVLIVLACTTTVAADGNNSSSNNSSTNATSAPSWYGTPAPYSSSSGPAVAYRANLWAYTASMGVTSYRAGLTTAIWMDVATAMGVPMSYVTLNDLVLVPNTTGNMTAVFTVRGTSTDARNVLAATNGAAASWAAITNALLFTFYLSMTGRSAAAAADYTYYTSLYVTSVERLGTAELPKTRYYEVVLEGKHLGAASLRANWNAAVSAGLATAFGVSSYMATHLNLTSQTLSGANSTVITIRFLVRPVVANAVNAIAFFASKGQSTASWLTQITQVHKDAAYAAFNVSTPAPVTAGRGAFELADSVPESEFSITVTGTSYAPGDESYSAAGGVATGVVAVAVSSLLVLMSLAMF